MKQKLLWDRHRFAYDLMIYFVFLVFAILIGEKNGLEQGYSAVLIFVSVIFSTVLILHYETAYLKGEGWDENLDNSPRFCLTLAIGAIGLFFCSYLPAPFVPFLAVGAVFSLITRESVGVLAGCEFVILMFLGSEMEVSSFLLFFLEVITGCVICENFLNRKNYLSGYFFGSGIQISLSILLSFWGQGFIKKEEVGAVAAGSLISFVITVFFFLIYQKFMTDMGKKKLEKISREDYYLRVLFRECAPDLYQRSRMISEISQKCASEIKADALLVKAAGCYLEAGMTEGNRDEKTSVKAARNNHFPEKMVKIIEEYSGKLHEPSSVEAAVCHLVYESVLLYEKMKNDRKFSKDRLEEELRQLFLENTGSGTLFHSGLSSNMQEVLLLTCIDGIWDWHVSGGRKNK